ncbi:hypothetical protein [Borreliella garinii]|uniref:BB0158 famile outer surface lipoprotein n=1 Tax=Borreliella garinii TaxID=29519 RepID=UPI001F30DA96|nr:hypothetical protein [Borreliella garinii]
MEEGNQNICYFYEESGIKEGELFELLAGGYVTWVKSNNLSSLKDRYNNLIKDLEELKYSYIFSPIRFKTYLWLSIATLIVLMKIIIRYSITKYL